MERIVHETWQALRRLARARLFSATVLIVIATSVAVATSMASLAAVVLQRALPYPEADRLVRLSEFNRPQQIPEMPPSLATVRVWREQQTVFDDFGVAHAPVNLTLQTAEGGMRLLGGLVSPEMFSTLGVRPILGRPFQPADGVVGSASFTIVLSHEVWTRVFGNDPSIVGRVLNVNGSSWEVVAVLPRATPLLPTSTETIDVWFPLGQAPRLLGRDVSNETRFRAFPMIGRLRADARPERVAGELSAMGGRLAELFPEGSKDWEWEAQPLAAVVTRGVRGPISAMVVSALLLLAVGIVNVLGLFVQRAARTARRAIVAVALGATRLGLLREAWLEAALLWLSGTLAGLGLATLALRARDSWIPFPMPPHLDARMEPVAVMGAVALAIVISGLTGAVTGAWWWRHASRGAPDSGRAITNPFAGWTARTGLAVQVALAAVLTVTALLAYTSIARLEAAETGFRSERLLTLRVDVTEAYAADRVHPVANAILQGLQAVPGVEQAALWASHVPAQAVWFSSVRVFDRPELRREGQLPLVRIHQVSAGAATMLGLRFIDGEDLSDADGESGRRVVLVSESAAREWWGTERAVGRRIQRWNQTEWWTVVGVVRDAPMSGRQGPGSAFVRDVYYLHRQEPQRLLVFLLRTRGDTTPVVAAARDAVRRAAPDLPLYAVRSMTDILKEQEQIGRSTARVGSVFAVLALVLLAVGLYGIVASVVTTRALEISVRKTLGASTGRILRDVAAPTLAVFAVGGAAGFGAASLLLPRLVNDVLFKVRADEPAAYLLAVLVLAAATVPAVVAPAWRGAARSPASVLRHGG